MVDPRQKLQSPADHRFATTRWSLVLAAGRRSSPQAETALAELCETYWYPVYAYIRRRGLSRSDAEDVTQDFFATLLEKDYLQAAEPDRGRFRSLLLTMVKRFLSKQRKQAGAAKRGGGRQLLSLDFESGEQRYQLEPFDDWTPERIFERRWAMTLLDRVLARLAAEYTDKGKSGLFDRLKVYLTGTTGAPTYEETAGALQSTEGAVKVAVHRLRRRYRECLKEEIANTVAGPDCVDDEFEHLLSALRGETT